MSKSKFGGDCKGCKPVIIDPVTMKIEPEDSFIAKAVEKVWGQTSLEEKESFHRVTCLNSRDPKDMEAIQKISAQVTKALKN